jgi:signal transduction histidine kinase/CheY-like chemotaxis protein
MGLRSSSRARRASFATRPEQLSRLSVSRATLPSANEPRRSKLRLLAEAQAARAEAEAARVRLAFLSEASAELAASLDVDATLERIAHLAIAGLADWCGIRFLDPNGIGSARLASADSTKHELLHETVGIMLRTPLPDDHPMARAIRQGESQLLNGPPDTVRARAAPTPELRERIDRLGLTSMILTPLRAQQRTLGLIIFGSTNRQYDADDVSLAEELARRASQAFENARLYTEAQQANQRKDEAFAALSRNEHTLRESEERYRTLFDHAPFAIWEQDFSAPIAYIDQLRASGITNLRAYFDANPDELARCIQLTRIVDVNETTLRMYHASSRDDLLAQLRQIGGQKDLTDQKEPILALASGATSFEREVVHRTLDGESLHLALRWAIVPGYERTCEKVLVSMVDISERRRLEQQLSQAQKLESIGRLAGGVAHDFNNILTAINGYAGLALETLAPGEPAADDLREIQKASERAAALTRQLLIFARKQQIDPHVLDLNALVSSVEKLLRRLIGEDVDLRTMLAPNHTLVKADPSQIEQVLVNLIVNARDAMPHGGTLTIETATLALDEEYAREHVGVAPGPYALLAVTDTGTGMDEAVRLHIFEPFFTTKEHGKGTGLGLATCYGIVKQHGGHIWVYSEVSAGTTFKVYLPLASDSAAAEESPLTIEDLPRGGERVLLVEDEPAVRDLAARVLRGQGYTVVEASNGAEALELLRRGPAGQFDLLLTDMIMPRLGGMALAQQIAADNPGLKLLFMSGYTDTTAEQSGLLAVGIPYLQKPFTPGALARRVRAVLDT